MQDNCNQKIPKLRLQLIHQEKWSSCKMNRQMNQMEKYSVLNHSQKYFFFFKQSAFIIVKRSISNSWLKSQNNFEIRYRTNTESFWKAKPERKITKNRIELQIIAGWFIIYLKGLSRGSVIRSNCFCQQLRNYNARFRSYFFSLL